MKNVQFTLGIGAHDLDRKVEQVRGFLVKGKQVRLSVNLFGRQREHPERAVEFLNDIVERVGDVGRQCAPASVKNLSVVVNPVKS